MTSSARSREIKAAAATFAGTTIEWYDFFLFGTAAALVFGPVFFTEATPAVGLLASFATFWVGFIARPIGGIVFGHLGDRFGRRGTLVATLLITGISTTLIGVLPGYVTIGIWAPILLVVLRALQGFGLGGEWSGAVTLATESAPKSRRGIAGMWVQQGSPAGSILATIAFLMVGQLDDEAFLAWGWRLPFLFSAVLVVVALIIRLAIEETPTFTDLKAQHQVARTPVFDVIRHAPGTLLLAMAASVIGIAMAYFVNTFTLSWTTNVLEVPRAAVLNVLLIVAILQFVVQPLAALLAQKVGLARLMTVALLAHIVVIVPMYLLIQSGEPVLIGVGLGLATVTGVSYFAVLAGFLAGAFPPAFRYSGLGLSYQLCATIVGGSTPLVAQALLTAFGNQIWGVALYQGLLAVVTIIGVIGLEKRIRRSEEAEATSRSTDESQTVAASN